jgi:hypothetical protein
VHPIGRGELAIALVLSAAMIGVLLSVGDYVMAIVVAVVAALGTAWQLTRGRKLSEEANSQEPEDTDS